MLRRHIGSIRFTNSRYLKHSSHPSQGSEGSSPKCSIPKTQDSVSGPSLRPFAQSIRYHGDAVNRRGLRICPLAFERIEQL